MSSGPAQLGLRLSLNKTKKKKKKTNNDAAPATAAAASPVRAASSNGVGVPTQARALAGHRCGYSVRLHSTGGDSVSCLGIGVSQALSPQPCTHLQAKVQDARRNDKLRQR